MVDNGYLYVSDSGKHEVKQWKIGDTHGTVVAGGNGEGDRLDQLSCPTFIFVGNDHSLHPHPSGRYFQHSQLYYIHFFFSSVHQRQLSILVKRH